MRIHGLVGKYHDHLFFLIRVLAGFLFFSHGAQKLFGWYGGSKVAGLASLMGVAGIVEVAAGIAIFVGLFTRLAAVLSAIQMLAAYFLVHAGNGWNPLVNQGELAILYLCLFLALMLHGNGKWSLEKALLKTEYF